MCVCVCMCVLGVCRCVCYMLVNSDDGDGVCSFLTGKVQSECCELATRNDWWQK